MANKQRDPKLEAFWRGVLAKFRDSGVSVRAFCRREKVTEPAFYAWRRIIRERDAQRRAFGPAASGRQLPRHSYRWGFVMLGLMVARASSSSCVASGRCVFR